MRIVVYSMFRPETHEILRELAHAWPRRTTRRELLVGEAYSLDVEQLGRVLRHPATSSTSPSTFMLTVHADLDAEEMRTIVGATSRPRCPPDAWPCWIGLEPRHRDASRPAGATGTSRSRPLRPAAPAHDPARDALRSTTETSSRSRRVHVPQERVRRRRATPSRDPGRTPMPWTRTRAAGRDPWLPLADTSRNVEEQRADPASTLALHARSHRASPSARPICGRAATSELPAPAGAWAWQRGERRRCRGEPRRASRAEIDGIEGSIALSTNPRGRRAREHSRPCPSRA